jgi:hypothetical protein
VNAMWIIVGCLATVGVYMLGWTRGRTHGIAEAGQWEALADEQDDELRAKDAELARADATIDMLRRNDDVAWQAGIVQGQLLQAEREEHGL